MSILGWLVNLPGVPDSWGHNFRKKALQEELEKRKLRVLNVTTAGSVCDLEIVISKDHVARVMIAKEVSKEICQVLYNEVKIYADHNGYRAYKVIVWVRNGFVPLDVIQLFGPRGINGNISFYRKNSLTEAAEYIQGEVLRLKEKGAT